MAEHTTRNRPTYGWPRVLRADDAAIYLGLSLTGFKRVVARGEITPKLLGERRVGYLIEDLDAWAVSQPYATETESRRPALS